MLTRINQEQAVYSFTTKRSLFDGAFVYHEQIKLAHDHRYPHMINSSKMNGVEHALDSYRAINDITWGEDCQQESAGWCFAWTSTFSITWKLQESESILLK